MKNDAEDIFEKAASDFIKNQNNTDTDETLPKFDIEKQRESALAIMDEDAITWNKLTETIKGKYAKRFMDEMDSLSSREFIRNYVKVLEYFVPKVNRQDPYEKENKDNELTIIVINRTSAEQDIDNETKTIDIDDNI